MQALSLLVGAAKGREHNKRSQRYAHLVAGNETNTFKRIENEDNTPDVFNINQDNL